MGRLSKRDWSGPKVQRWTAPATSTSRTLKATACAGWTPPARLPLSQAQVPLAPVATAARLPPPKSSVRMTSQWTGTVICISRIVSTTGYAEWTWQAGSRPSLAPVTVATAGTVAQLLPRNSPILAAFRWTRTATSMSWTSATTACAAWTPPAPSPRSQATELQAIRVTADRPLPPNFPF